MAIGNPVSLSSLNAQLGAIAVEIRDAAFDAQRLWGYISSLGSTQAAQVTGLGVCGLSTASNPNNPGSVSDAQLFWTNANYAFAVSQLYYGQISQASTFNYDGGLAAARGGS